MSRDFDRSAQSTCEVIDHGDLIVNVLWLEGLTAHDDGAMLHTALSLVIHPQTMYLFGRIL